MRKKGNGGKERLYLGDTNIKKSQELAVVSYLVDENDLEFGTSKALLDFGDF